MIRRLKSVFRTFTLVTSDHPAIGKAARYTRAWSVLKSHHPEANLARPCQWTSLGLRVAKSGRDHELNWVSKLQGPKRSEAVILEGGAWFHDEGPGRRLWSWRPKSSIFLVGAHAKPRWRMERVFVRFIDKVASGCAKKSAFPNWRSSSGTKQIHKSGAPKP